MTVGQAAQVVDKGGDNGLSGLVSFSKRMLMLIIPRNMARAPDRADMPEEARRREKKSMKLRYGLLAGSLLTAAVTLGSVLVCTPVFAQPVQGLYISGEGGASFNQGQVIRHSSARDEFKTGATGIGSIGWGLGNGFRVEVEGLYRNNDLKTVGGNAAYHAHADGRQQESGVMANALFDMDIGKSWLFPYFGAGIGYGWQNMNTTITGNVNGQSYSQHVGGTYGNFAYQAFSVCPSPCRSRLACQPRRNTGSGPCLARSRTIPSYRAAARR